MRVSDVLTSLRDRLRSATSAARAETDEMRAAIQTARVELKHAQRGPLPLDEIQDRIVAAVRSAGARWLAEHGPTLIRSEGGLAAYNAKYGGRAPFVVADPIPFGAWCAGAPDTMVALLGGLYAAVPYEAGPPSPERPTLIARLERELAELERAEEAVIDDAAAAGIAISHRPEVVRRRQEEARRREREEREIADRARRQAALDVSHETRHRGRFCHPEPPQRH